MKCKIKNSAIFFLLLQVPLISISSNFDGETNGSPQSAFIQNIGQIGDGNGGLHPEVLFKSSFNDVTLFFKKDGIVYLFNKYETVPNEESGKERAAGNIAKAKILETKPLVFRMDLVFQNPNPAMTVIPSGKRTEVSNYYLAHCPDGVLNVNHFDSVTYKNIYHNIDITYYYDEKGLKYDIVVFPGGNISDIRYKYIGANSVKINKQSDLEIDYAEGQILTEEKPVAFLRNNKSKQIQVNYFFDSHSGSVGFSGEKNTLDEPFVIDPPVKWATYFYNTNSANSSWSNPEYDASGNLFLADQTYDNAYPLQNPGGGAYYDAAKSTMIKLVIMKFSSSRALFWATYYGGDNYDCLAGTTDYGKSLALDNSGNVYVAGYTNSPTTVFPTLNPGGGAFYQDQSRCYGETSFFLKFNNNGIRIWATMFTHETASTSGTMIRINGITCDGTNLFFTGQQYDWTPANTIPLRNPGGGAHYQTSILGSQDVFVGKFNSSQVLVWDTYVHSTNPANTAFGQGSDLHCDASGNLFLVGRESGANSHHYLVNPGGGAYYQATKGANGDLFITKFNSSLTAVWGTYYGGNGMDIPHTLEPDYLGNFYILGRVTQSTDFPTQDPGGGALYQAAKSNAASDGFLIKFNASGVRQWGTYLGANVPAAGSDENHFTGIAFNPTDNNIFVSGDTKSILMTTVNKGGSYNQAANAGGYDMFYYEFNSAGVVQWASYYGKSQNETCYDCRLAFSGAGCGTKLLSMVITASMDMTGVDPGGGAWYQGTTTFGYNNFILEMGNATAPPGGSTWTWTGAINTDWHTACNWDKQSVPVTTSNVVIPGGTSNNPTISSADADCYDITINSGNGAVLTISGARILNVTKP